MNFMIELHDFYSDKIVQARCKYATCYNLYCLKRGTGLRSDPSRWP